MENKKIVEEFITKHREHKPPYTVDREKMTIIIDRRVKKTPADEKAIELLIKAGYIPTTKRTDITKADMTRYVKNNYDKKELELLQEKLDTINETDTETGNLITFATIKSWFKNRYVYYPKGIKWNFGKSTSAQEKKERFLKAFEEHKEELKKDWADSRPQVPLNTQKEVTHQEQPQDNKNKHHNH